MKRFTLILATILMAVSAFGDPVLSLPVATPKAYVSNPTKGPEIKDAFCEFAGLPQTAAGWQAVKQQASWTLVTNVVGNVELGVPAGSDWYINNDSINNWFGKKMVSNTYYNITFNTNSLPTNCVISHIYIDLYAKSAQLRSYTNLLMVGEWNPSSASTFAAWGIVSQEE